MRREGWLQSAPWTERYGLRTEPYVIVIDADAAPGERELRIGTPRGLSNPVVFRVGSWPEHYETEPNDYRTMVEVRNNGVPLIVQAPKSAITQAIRELAVKLCGEREEDIDGEGAAKSNDSKWKKFWPGAKS